MTMAASLAQRMLQTFGLRKDKKTDHVAVTFVSASVLGQTALGNGEHIINHKTPRWALLQSFMLMYTHLK